MTTPEALLEDAITRFWALSDLSWKLDDHQLEIHTAYRQWEKNALAPSAPANDNAGGMARIFVLDCGRRVGKTFVSLLIKVEDCLRRPRSIHTYATAFAKDIAEIVIPIMDEICADAPVECRPIYRKSAGGMAEGYRFPNGSIIRLVGIDIHPRALRGRKSDGFVVSEAGHVKGLRHTVGAIIYPQFMRLAHARLILESSAPEDPEHDFDEVFVPDAKRRNAYVFRTIDDNTALTQEERDEFVNAAKAIDPDDAEREYFGKRVRNRTKVVVPEFDEHRHVRDHGRPRYAVAMAAMDPGMRDLFALLWGYWDAARAKLVIERDWCARNASTRQVAEVIRAAEIELYGPAAALAELAGGPVNDNGGQAGVRRGFGLRNPGGFTWWDGKEFRANPLQRISDTEARLIGDLTNDYKIQVINTLKDDKEAALYALRNAFGNDKIEIHPRCVKTISHVNSARWNDQRTDYERTPGHGHYDLLDALVYLWRMIQPIRNQMVDPPEHIDKADRHVLFLTPPSGVANDVQRLRNVFGGKRDSWR